MRSARVWARLLGLGKVVVEDVEFDEDEAAIVVSVRPRKAARRRCGRCGVRCPGYDQGEGRRRWRTLDLGLVRAFLEADSSRVRCPEHGVVAAQVPRARHGAGHTYAFDDTAAWLVTHCSKSAVRELMRIAWRTVGSIVTRVVADAEAGTDRFADLRRIGIDEISYKRGHRYLTVVVDHDTGVTTFVEALMGAEWMVPWDDHEVVNDYDAFDPALSQLRANGYRAFWEHMPLCKPQFPDADTARMHRHLTYGDLVRFHVLDTRQHRTTQFPGATIGDIPERRDPSRQMLGVEQEAWLLDGLGSGGTTWDALANTVLFSRLDSDDSDGERFSTGQWDSYQAAQQRVIDTVIAKDVDGFVVLTGDIHRNYHLNVLADFDNPDSAVVGVEFAGTSISSGRDGTQTDAGQEVRKRANPHLVTADLWRGYLRCRITHDEWATEVRAIDRINTLSYQAWPSQTLRTFPGRPGIVQA